MTTQTWNLTLLSAIFLSPLLTRVKCLALLPLSSSDAPDGRIDKLVTDTHGRLLSIVHPLPGPNAASQLSLDEADKSLRAATAQYKLKNKYRFILIPKQIGYKFFPIIFESFGKMHNHTSSFFKIC